MTAPTGALRFRSLGARLVILLTLALFPLGLIALYQTIRVVDDAEKFATRDILARTERAASAENALIRRAYGAGYALGTTALEVGPGSSACSAIMARFVERSEAFIFAGFIDAGGMMRCSSDDRIMDFSTMPGRSAFLENPMPTVTINRRGAVTGESVLLATVPILNEADEFLGSVSISVPHVLSDMLLASNVEGVDIAIVNREGEVLSASTGIDNVEVFRALERTPAEIVRQGGTVSTTLESGERRVLAVSPLLDGQLFAVGSWARAQEAFAVSVFGIATPAFPVVMWLASLFVAYFAVDRLVLRHLKRLRSGMASFSADDAAESHVHLSGAPTELAQIADSYNKMIDRIVADHDALEAALHEKEVLLREVHHRVKNNLQLIASILSMQMRSTGSETARSVIRRVQDRVMSLATIHKALYTDAEVGTVRADRIVSEIVRGVFSIGLPARTRVRTEVELSRVDLDPDQAVPLALLVNEAVTNSAKHVGRRDDGTAYVRIRFSEANGAVELLVENTRGARIADFEAGDGTGLGNRLIEAFVSQLGGTLETEETETDYAMHVRFSKLGAGATGHRRAA